MLEVLTGVLLLSSLEFFVSFAKQTFQKLGPDSVLIELVFLICSVCRFLSEYLLGVLARVETNR